MSAVLVAQFDPTTYTVSEGTAINILITLSFVADRDVTVDFATVDGTAIGEHNDYSC